MGLFGTLGVKLRQRKATIAAVLTFAVIGLGIFFVGTWAGSTGTLNFGTVTASAPPVNDAPAGHGPDEPCCGKPMMMDKDHQGPKMREGMPMDKDHQGPKMREGMPMDNMPMDKMGPKPGMDCCDK